jgi:hypothetical protein
MSKIIIKNKILILNRYFKIPDLNHPIYIDYIQQDNDYNDVNFGFNQIHIPKIDSDICLYGYYFTNNVNEIDKLNEIFYKKYDVSISPQGKLFGLTLQEVKQHNYIQQNNSFKVDLNFHMDSYDATYIDIIEERKRKIKKIKQSINNKTLN